MRQSSCYFDNSGTNVAEPASPMRIGEPSECIYRLTSAVFGEPSAPHAEKLAFAALQEQDFCCVRLLITASRLRVALEALCEWATNLAGWEAPCWREAENVLAEMAGKPCWRIDHEVQAVGKDALHRDRPQTIRRKALADASA